MDIKATVSREPCWLLEAAELAFALVNDIPAERLTAQGTYCIPPQEVEKLLAFAGQKLNPQDKRLRFYFHSVTLEGQSLRDSCLAFILLYSSMQVLCADPVEMGEACISTWEQYRAAGYRISGIDFFTLDLSPSAEHDFMSISEELAGLPAPQSYKVELVEVLSNYALHVRSLVSILEPVFRQLPELMEPWVKKARDLVDAWELFFAQNSPRTFLDQRGGVVCEGMQEFRMALRYLNPPLTPWTAGKVVQMHMGVAIGVGMEPPPASHKPEDWECKVLQLLSSPSRIDMLRMMMEQSMNIQMIVKALNLNPGAVSRDLNSLFETTVLQREIRDGRSFYRTNPKTLAQVAEHVIRYITQG